MPVGWFANGVGRSFWIYMGVGWSGPEGVRFFREVELNFGERAHA